MRTLTALGLSASLSLSLCSNTFGQTPPQHPALASEVPSDAMLTPRYLLMTPSGRAVMADDFRGRFQLIAFGFISCPDVCPTTLLHMTHVLNALGERAKHVQPLFVTVDPQRDTPEVLAAYTKAFDARILGLTGAPELIRKAADSFGVFYEKVQEPGDGPNVYTMNHTAGMFLLDPQGRLIAKLGYSLPTDTLVERIQRWLTAAGK